MEFQQQFAQLYKAASGVIQRMADVAREELQRGDGNVAVRSIQITEPVLMNLMSTMMRIDYEFMPKVEKYLADNGVKVADELKARVVTTKPETKNDVH